MSFTMGYTPQECTVVLTPGADFVCTLSRVDSQPWPAGLQLTLQLGTHQWDAELSGDLATWVVDQELVDAALADDPQHARLWYVDGDTRLLWAAGRVQVQR